MRFDCVVIGAGVAGLTCARAIAGSGYSIAVCEQQDRLGGRVRTLDFDGCQVEVGAQFVTNFYSRFWHAISEIPTAFEHVHVRVGYASPNGARDFTFLVRDPARVWKFALSIPGVIRAAAAAARNWSSLDPSQLWRAATSERGNLGEWNRLSKGSVESVFGPAIRHFLYWDPDSTSDAFAPVLLKAALVTRSVSRPVAGFGALASEMGAGLQVWKGFDVARISKLPGEEFEVSSRDGRTYRTKSVVLATDGLQAQRLGVDFLDDPRLHMYLKQLSYSSTMVVSGYFEGWHCRSSTIVNLLDQESVWAAVTVTRSVRGSVVSVFVTNAIFQELLLSDDQGVCDFVISKLREEVPDFLPSRFGSGWHVQRWDQALPRFPAGSLGLLSAARDALDALGGSFTLAGDYLSGPFVEGAVESGLAAADRVTKYLREK